MMKDFKNKAFCALYQVKGGYVLEATHDELYGINTSIHIDIDSALKEISRVFKLIEE